MALSIVNWNIDENRAWFVRLEDTGSVITAELYLSQTDSEAQSNLQASGESSGYGSVLEISLENESGATTPVSLFQGEYAWHLIVSGQNGDSTKIYKIKEFVELDEISHAIYRNSALITSRATAEIDAHTHAAKIRDISLGAHLPEMEIGDIIRTNSDRLGLDDLSQITDMQITGSINDDGEQSLLNEIETRKYIELKR